MVERLGEVSGRDPWPLRFAGNPQEFFLRTTDATNQPFSCSFRYARVQRMSDYCMLVQACIGLHLVAANHTMILGRFAVVKFGLPTIFSDNPLPPSKLLLDGDAVETTRLLRPFGIGPSVGTVRKDEIGQGEPLSTGHENIPRFNAA